MSTYHKVQAGEYLAGIAALYGISPDTIWNDPGNVRLKQKRENPNVLFPGDNLTIPDKVTKTEKIITGKQHQFRLILSAQSLFLRIVVKDNDNKPIANAECTLEVDGKSYQLSTDSKGKIEQEIPATAKQGTLTFQAITIPLKIGHLDPVEETTGQIARLNNLGYNAGNIEKLDEQQFLSAVEEFQCDHKLSVDGKCGPNTQKKLLEIHGC